MANETPVPVTVGNAFEKGAFFILEPSFWARGKFAGIEIANEAALALPGAHTVEPVSYTHLDVYKRQAMASGAKRRIMGLPPWALDLDCRRVGRQYLRAFPGAV